MPARTRFETLRNCFVIPLAACWVSLVPGSLPTAASQEPIVERGARAATPSKRTIEPYRKRLALVIGIDRYQNGIGPLRYAVGDALAVKEILETKLGFQVRLLLNEKAKKEGIINAIISLHDQTSREDQLLFFFAGHGVSFGERDQEIGYVLPSDARGLGQSAAWHSGLPMDELVGHLTKLPPKHILIILDACFSGYAAVTPRGSVAKNPDQLLLRLTSQPARQLLSAGMRGQQVFETVNGRHSFFVLDFLRAFGEDGADYNHDGVIQASELYAFVKPAVTARSDDKQTPYLATLDRSQGEFVFIPRAGAIPALTKEGTRRKALIVSRQVPLFRSAYAQESHEATFLQTYFLFQGEENQRVPVGLDPGATEPDGWLAAGSFVEWNSLEVALVTAPMSGKPSLALFSSRECALRFAAAQDARDCAALPVALFGGETRAEVLMMVPLLERWGEAYRGLLIPLQLSELNRKRLESPAAEGAEEEIQQARSGLLVGWLPRTRGRQLLVRESVFMRRDDAQILTNIVDNISLAAREGSIEGIDYFLRTLRAAFSGIGLTPEDDEPLDAMLAKSSVLPFRTTVLSFSLQEVKPWKKGDFEHLHRQLESKILGLRLFLQDPRNAYSLNGKSHVFIPRDLFP